MKNALMIGLALSMAGMATGNTTASENEITEAETSSVAGRTSGDMESADNLTIPTDALDETRVGIAAKFISIRPGEFVMGSPDDEDGRLTEEVQHRVKFTKGFEMQATEVTQLQYFLVTARNSSYYKDGEDCDTNNFKVVNRSNLCVNHPVEQVSWDEAQEFIRELNKIQDECAYRLPTEAEWEYAARDEGHCGFSCLLGFRNTNKLNNSAWHYGNSNNRTHAVATKKANSLGLYDMLGNVFEWVEDWHGEYPLSSVTDPTGPTAGSFRVYKGGAFLSYAEDLRSAYRRFDLPGESWSAVGFRLVRSCR